MNESASSGLRYQMRSILAEKRGRENIWPRQRHVCNRAIKAALESVTVMAHPDGQVERTRSVFGPTAASEHGAMIASPRGLKWPAPIG